MLVTVKISVLNDPATRLIQSDQLLTVEAKVVQFPGDSGGVSSEVGGDSSESAGASAVVSEPTDFAVAVETLRR